LVVAIFLVVAVLIAVGAALTLGRSDSVSSADPAAQPQPSSPADTRDLGTVDAGAAGVKGHLTTKWDGKLGYNFLVEPDAPARQAAFEQTVSNPSRPALIRIQIKSPDGVVVCFQDVLLKFDPRKAPALSDAPVQTPRGKPLSAKAADELKNDKEAELARQDAAEAEREQGRDIFQVNTGSDGKIESISSHGEIPCPQTVYEGMGYWTFLPDFPSADEQTKSLNGQTEELPNAALIPSMEANGHKADNFSLAGDDAIVEYEAAAGSIHTRTGKVFSIDKAGAGPRVIARLDLPAKIHYSCDQKDVCTLTQGDALLVHAHLMK